MFWCGVGVQGRVFTCASPCWGCWGGERNLAIKINYLCYYACNCPDIE